MPIELTLDSVGGIFRNAEGHFIKIYADVPVTKPEYAQGFRFLDTEDRFYRPDGTAKKTSSLVEDVTAFMAQIVWEGGRVTKTSDDATNLLFKDKLNFPHGFAQWKGTDICMDIHCRCGYHSHVDGYFAHRVECPACHRTYVANFNIELVEYTDRRNQDDGSVLMDNEVEIDMSSFDRSEDRTR